MHPEAEDFGEDFFGNLENIDLLIDLTGLTDSEMKELFSDLSGLYIDQKR